RSSPDRSREAAQPTTLPGHRAISRISRVLRGQRPGSRPFRRYRTRAAGMEISRSWRAFTVRARQGWKQPRLPYRPDLDLSQVRSLTLLERNFPTRLRKQGLGALPPFDEDDVLFARELAPTERPHLVDRLEAVEIDVNQFPPPRGGVSKEQIVG